MSEQEKFEDGGPQENGETNPEAGQADDAQDLKKGEEGSEGNPGGDSKPVTEEEAGVEPELDPVAQLAADVEKWRDLALRNQADLENFRKRMARDKQDAVRYANSGLLESLLPILDNFEMGLEAARTESEESMIFQGMQMVMNQLRAFLEELGVSEVETAGLEFDPKLHEAVSQEPSDTVPEGGIVRVMRRGYRLRDRLLRAPAVVVSKGAEAKGEGA